jgi:hypothetical protein
VAGLGWQGQGEKGGLKDGEDRGARQSASGDGVVGRRSGEEAWRGSGRRRERGGGDKNPPGSCDEMPPIDLGVAASQRRLEVESPDGVEQIEGQG